MGEGKRIIDAIGRELVRLRRKKKKVLCILISQESRKNILQSVADNEINFTKSRTLFGIPMGVNEQLEQPFLVVPDIWDLREQ